ncbi:MAG: YggS family pyridoxal phosphate-dependent enzyme [Thomasclavelia sp.]|uniref:YggS family pyridoxal phosphate-dependent enzyme n=1 Tax=Thomasclavelia sp. TaxID=3025757 RepID=UPI00399FE4C0
MEVNELEVEKLVNELKSVKLVAATKYVGIDEINKLEELGVKYFGENRVQALLEKYEKYEGNCEFHMIGTLQANKVKYIIDKVSLIHSVDSYSLIKEIEKQAKKHDIVARILIQVNVAKEESKHGFEIEEVEDVLRCLKNYPHIKVEGLMMMAPNIEPEKTRKYFKQTKELLDKLKLEFPEYSLNELSMGMSNDYQIALEYGATMIRIGSALFK